MAAANTSSNAPVALITGASRGIGLGLVRVFAAKGYRVIAAARDPAKAEALNQIVKSNPLVSTVALDVSDAKSIAALPAAVAGVKPAVGGVDVLINNAGILSPDGKTSTLATEDSASLTAVFQTNVVGVHGVTQQLLPLLRKAHAAGGARVVNISSLLGSIDFLVNGAWPPRNAAYRISKTALNALSAIQAREYNADAVAAAASADAKAKAAAPALITVLALHPGYVETDMTKGGGAPTTVEQSANGLYAVITGAKPDPKVWFGDFEGKKLDW